MSHTSRFRFKKRLTKRHQSSRRMSFYAEEHAGEAKPFPQCEQETEKKS
ncbi:MAG: hypothetical protein HRU25_00910 [Psychrobium sp.]|nr:hypothetical protein [Psychrobium sp.]